MNKQDKLNSIKSRIEDGWFQILDIPEEWEDIVIDCHEQLVKIDPDYTILQIKEKFGGLRYYFNSDSPRHKEMIAIVMEHEKASFSVPHRH